MTRLQHWAWFAAAILISASPLSSQQSGKSERIPQFENDEVKVWKSIVAPNAPLAMHRHDHPRIIIAMVGGKMNIVSESGATEPNDWKTGNAYWLTANPPDQRHADVNSGNKPIEVMVVELKKAK